MHAEICFQQKEKGDESGLHIIIFDELDAICKQRGSTNSGTGVGDSVVNQLLSKVGPGLPFNPVPTDLGNRWTVLTNSITYSSSE